jgi:hypothetical protein
MLQKLKLTSYAFIYFLMFGFSFIALQVTTEEVEAAGVCEPVDRIKQRNNADSRLWVQRCAESGRKSTCGNMAEWPRGDGGRCVAAATRGGPTPPDTRMQEMGATPPSHGGMGQMGMPEMGATPPGHGGMGQMGMPPMGAPHPKYTMACTAELPRQCIPMGQLPQNPGGIGQMAQPPTGQPPQNPSGRGQMAQPQTGKSPTCDPNRENKYGMLGHRALTKDEARDYDECNEQPIPQKMVTCETFECFRGDKAYNRGQKMPGIKGGGASQKCDTRLYC